jgi:hypothetical protein
VCWHCGDRIDVYEPTIVDSNGEVRETSVAAEHDLASSAGELYHLSCHSGRSNDRQRRP